MNFLALAAIVLLLGLVRLFLNHDQVLGIAAIVLSAVIAVVHFVRVRRFKRYDQARKND